MTCTRRVRRTVCSAALLAATVTLPAAAQSGPAGPAPATRSGKPASAYDRVADFYGTYIDAVYDSGHGRLATDLRNHFLTADLRTRLAAWEGTHDTDGVLGAQDLPTAWKVTYESSGAGHTFSRVTLTWGGTRVPSYTYLRVRSDLASWKISDIKDAPNPKPK